MVSKAVLFFFFLISLTSDLSAQKEDHKWIFNLHPYDDVTNEPMYGASVLDFNTLPPRAYKDQNITLDFNETNSFYSDENGELLLYTNGQAIHGADHKPIINGDTINYGRTWDIWTLENENGLEQPNGFRVYQGVSIIPIPESEDELLVVYNNTDKHYVIGDPYQLFYSVVKKIDSSNFEVVEKDYLLNDYLLNMPIHACRHGNGSDWWVLLFTDNTVYTYLIDAEGIQLAHRRFLPFVIRTGFSQSSYSLDGSKFSLTSTPIEETATGVDILIADFDRCTGRLDNPLLMQEPSFNTGFGYGVEFSPDGNLLYTTTGTNIYQFDLNADDIQASKLSVGEYDNSLCDYSQWELFFGYPKLAPDKKIYVGSIVQCFNISVINQPNVRGRGCDFQHNVIKKPTFSRNTLPNTNTWRLGPLDGSSCDTLGLDNDPVSRFWYEQDSLSFLDVQFWDVSYFRPEAWSWTFGDGQNSKEREPLHSYAEKGIYEVCLTVSNENSSHTSCQDLNLGISTTSDTELTFDISVYPNPTDDYVRIAFHDYLPEAASVYFYNITGQLVLQQRLSGGANMLDLSKLNAGTYLYEVRDQGQVLLVDKLILMRS